MDEDKIIDNFSPTGWEARKVTCLECGHTVISVHPYKIKLIECSECGVMFDYKIIKLDQNSIRKAESVAVHDISGRLQDDLPD